MMRKKDWAKHLKPFLVSVHKRVRSLVNRSDSWCLLV